jgi:glycosyltransferase involved in cell wall biosynthesis
MRIAYISADFGVPIFGYKGASVHVREMAAAWRSLGHEVVVFSPSATRSPDVADEIQVVAVEPLPVFSEVAQELRALDNFLDMATRVRHDLRNLLFNLALARAVEARMRAAPFDFIYERYTLFNYAGAALARQLGLPHILEVNAPLAYEQEKMRGLEMKRLAQELERRILTAADYVAVVSEQLRRFALDQGVPAERILVTPNGVNPRRFHPDSSARRRVREQLGLKEQIVIGFVGSLKPWHGTETLVTAFRNLLNIEPAIHLLIVGNGPQRESLEAQAQALGLETQVTFTGDVAHHEVPAYIGAMDIAVAPYIPNDNFYFSPIKLFEYMAMGKPVAASAIGQAAETIHHCETGLLYTPGNVDELQATLHTLVSQPALRLRLGQAGLDWVVRQRTWDTNALAVLQAVERVKHPTRLEAA